MKKSGLSALFLLVAFSLFSQSVTSSAGMSLPLGEGEIRTAEEGFASQEFRRGVQAYYRGAFNDAILQFERALSYLPNDSLILEWLGKSYYKSGLEGSALSYWQTAADNGYGGLLLQNKIEIVRERRVTGDSTEKLMRLSEVGNFSGVNDGQLIFSGPVSVLPNSDGSFWLTAYNSNEVLRISMNGFVTDRITGPLLTGFDRPVDIIRLDDGSLLVSESAGNRLARLSKNGFFQQYIGSKGRGVGQMIGPQYMATDDFGRIYVTDFGNRRVDVFDSEGNGLFYFGSAQGSFKGLKCPTGIAVVNDTVFVADDFYGLIYEFDLSGNYIRELVEKDTLDKPEAIKFWQGNLIVCDKNRILSVDVDTGAFFEYVRTGNAPSGVMTAAPDVNNNVLVADFTSNEVYVMSKVQELVGGLFVQLENVDASKFPEVTVEVKVENRHRQPLVGLTLDNFYFSENKRPVSNLSFIGSVSNNTYADITIVIDRSVSVSALKGELETAVREIGAAMDGQGTLRVVCAGSVPTTEYQGSPSGVANFSTDALKTPVASDSAVDLALRLAANDLINSAKKRAIIMISDGKVSDKAFSRYNLTEITAYLNNNNIDFSFVQLNQNAVAPELNYLVENTLGELYYVFRPQGLGNIVGQIVELPQGVYQLKYTSTMTTNFGERYLPLEVEVYMLNRSGRDETGYFAPLE